MGQEKWVPGPRSSEVHEQLPGLPREHERVHDSPPARSLRGTGRPLGPHHGPWGVGGGGGNGGGQLGVSRRRYRVGLARQQALKLHLGGAGAQRFELPLRFLV